VPGYPEAYVVGDLAGIKQDGEPLPMVSQVGIQTGTAAAKNILRQVADRTPSPFRYHDKGAIDVIGRNAAVARMWGFSFSGFVAWVIWAVLHIYRLIGFRNRLILMINWAWDYLFREHGVRLIVPSEASLSQVANATGSSEQADIFAGVNHPQEMERKWFSQATKE
jgi:NADH dehydrogenase